MSITTTLDISNANYFMVIFPLNGILYFLPCNLLTTSSFKGTFGSVASLEIKDSCITDQNRDKVLSIGDHRIEDYIQRTGTQDCVLVDNLINKMFQASTTSQQSQSDNDLIQKFMRCALLQAITSSGAHQIVNEEVLKAWIYVIVTPIEWGKQVTSDALFSVFEGSDLITPSNALVMAAFDALLLSYLQVESFAERNTLPNSKNILCELSVGKAGDVSLSMDTFSITKLKGPQYEVNYMTIDSSPSIPTLFSNIRIELNAGLRKLVGFFRDAIKGEGELSPQICDELFKKLCTFLVKFERGFQERGSLKLGKIYPFQTCPFSPSFAELDISALRSITLEDIHATLSSHWGLIKSEIQSLIEKEICITRVFFIVVPEIPPLYPDSIEDVLFISIVLLKFEMEASSIKKYKFIYDTIKRLHDNSNPLPYTPINGHLNRTVTGVSIKLVEKLRAICQESLPLSTLTHSVIDTSNIDTINYVYLFTNQVITQNVSINKDGTLTRLSAQKSDIISLDQFLIIDDAEAKSEETMLRFRFSKSALSLLESKFPEVLHEFATLYREPKEDLIPEGDAATDASCLNLESWYDTLQKKYNQLLHSESGKHETYYTKIMNDLVHHQSDPSSHRIDTTQQKYVGTFTMVYFGYLKETLARDFGPDTDSTRYILIFEHLMRNVTIGHADDKLMRRALDLCKWVLKTEENKRKLMVYDLEDNFPISECLQKEGIKMIPAKARFMVITMTRHYIKSCINQALEDILPTDKFYKQIKGADFTHTFDFYGTVCTTIWQHVQESIYKSDCLFEYPSNMDISDFEDTLESYNTFKVAFSKYIMTTFPVTYASHPDEQHRFPFQDNCSIVLTNRLVLDAGVLPAILSLMNLTGAASRASPFVFFRPFNFDDDNNPSLPMLRLLETKLKKLLDVRFRRMIWISVRQFASIHSHPCLKSVIGDTAFGYEALKTGVIRAIDSSSFALGFQYFVNDKTSFVEAITNRVGPSPQVIQGTDACIITKFNAPHDNTKKHSFISDLAFKIPNFRHVSKIHVIKINDTVQRNIGDIISVRRHDHTILSTFEMRDLLFRDDDAEKFASFPYVNLYLIHSSPMYTNSIVLHSPALMRPLQGRSMIRPLKVAYFDSYEEKAQ